MTFNDDLVTTKGNNYFDCNGTITLIKYIFGNNDKKRD
jgi:hypothetical protein